MRAVKYASKWRNTRKGERTTFEVCPKKVNN